MTLTDLWPVLVDHASEALVMEGGGPVPAGWAPVPVYGAAGALAKAIAFRTGSGSFFGNSGSQIDLPGIAHSLPSGFTLESVDVQTALKIGGGGGPWFALGGQYAAADATDFYWAFQLPPAVAGEGSFAVAGGVSQAINGDFSIAGGSSTGTGSVTGSSVLGGNVGVGVGFLDPAVEYFYGWTALGMAF